VEKAMGTMQLSMDSLYRIDAHSKACMVDPEDKTELDLDTEFLPPMSYLSSRLGSLLLHLLHALAHVYLWLAIYKIE
jgi:hypothetical protein